MNSREAALNILIKIEKDNTYLNQVQKSIPENLERQDRSFASALIFGVLENKIRLDYIIDSFLTKKKLDTTIRNILRLGTYQIIYMDVPSRAAVNESVKLTISTPKKALKGFVNAVLRKIADNYKAVVYPDKSEIGKYLSVAYSYPEWLVSMLVFEYGTDTAEKILSHKNADRGISVRINRLHNGKIPDDAEISAYHKNACRINGENIENLPSYISGEITPQSEASMFCVEAAGIREGMSVLDLCAAPGGKSAYAAEFKPKRLVSCDVYEHRVELMKKNFNRLGVDSECLINDASKQNRDFINTFDAVLIDAPCSALGLMHRKPDIKYSRSKEGIDEIIALQKRILETSAEYVKSGGTLLYSTCTLNTAENSDNIKDFLEKHSEFEVLPFDDATLRNIAGENSFEIQFMPHIHGIDGFYIARMRKK